jgi:hypothetical protein
VHARVGDAVAPEEVFAPPPAPCTAFFVQCSLVQREACPPSGLSWTLFLELGKGAGWIVVDNRDRKGTWHSLSTGGSSRWTGLNQNGGVGVIVLVASHRLVDKSGFRLLTESARTGRIPPRRGINGGPGA